MTAVVGLQTVCQPWRMYDSYSGTSDCVLTMENGV